MRDVAAAPDMPVSDILVALTRSPKESCPIELTSKAGLVSLGALKISNRFSPFGAIKLTFKGLPIYDVKLNRAQYRELEPLTEEVVQLDRAV